MSYLFASGPGERYLREDDEDEEEERGPVSGFAGTPTLADHRDFCRPELKAIQRAGEGARIPGGQKLQKVWRRARCHRDRECFCCPGGGSHWRWDFVYRGRGPQVSRIEWDSDGNRAGLAVRQCKVEG